MAQNRSVTIRFYWFINRDFFKSAGNLSYNQIDRNTR
jgi:hypothetical protein